MSTPTSERLQQLQQFLENSPSDSFLLFALAKEYESLQALPKAFEYYLLLLEKDPAYVGLYYHLGKLYEAEEKWEKALATYTEGMRVAKEQGDKHAFSELAGAKEELEE